MPGKIPRDAGDKFYAGFAGIQRDKWDKWDSAGRGMAAQAVILARHWDNLTPRGPLAFMRHGVILTAESCAVHRTMVGGHTACSGRKAVRRSACAHAVAEAAPGGGTDGKGGANRQARAPLSGLGREAISRPWPVTTPCGRDASGRSSRWRSGGSSAPRATRAPGRCAGAPCRAPPPSPGCDRPG